MNALDPTPAIQLVGVNGIQYSSGNDYVTKERDIPWLQDTIDVDLWTQWGIQYRDVVVLDGENKPIFIMNLSAQSLSDPDNYAELRERLLSASSDAATSTD